MSAFNVVWNAGIFYFALSTIKLCGMIIKIGKMIFEKICEREDSVCFIIMGGKYETEKYSACGG